MAALIVLPLPVTVAARWLPKLIVSFDAVRMSPLAALMVAPVPLTVSVELADSVTVLPEATLIVLPVPVSVAAAPAGSVDDDRLRR